MKKTPSQMANLHNSNLGQNLLENRSYYFPIHLILLPQPYNKALTRNIERKLKTNIPNKYRLKSLSISLLNLVTCKKDTTSSLSGVYLRRQDWFDNETSISSINHINIIRRETI